MFFQLGEEIEGVERLQLIEVRASQFFDHFAIERSEEHLLMAVLVGEVGSARRKRFAEFVLALLMPFQDFASALDHAAGEPREAGNFDAITLVGAAGLDAPQENNLAGRFFHGHMDILHRGQQVSKLGEFMIVRGKKRARAGVLLKMLDDSPGNGEAVERRCAAADFVEQNQARRRSMIENGRNFAHLHEKRGTSAGQIVAGANARENAVRDGQLGLPRGNKRTHLRHQHNQGGLAQVRGFAAHVWSGDEQELLAARFETQIVGHEALTLLPQQLFDHRMTPADDEKFSRRIEFRADIAAIGGKFRKRREHVELRDGGSGPAQAHGF